MKCVVSDVYSNVVLSDSIGIMTLLFILTDSEAERVVFIT